jgi:hypothetical protein
MNQSSVTPGVVLKTKFVTSDKKAFQEYVEYVDRDDVKRDQSAILSVAIHYNTDNSATCFSINRESYR